MRKLKYSLCFLVLLTILFTSCSDSAEEKLDNEINKALRTKNNVDETEWKNISTIVNDNIKIFPELASPAGTADLKKINNYIVDFANKRKRNNTPPDIYTPIDSTIKQITHFNFYIENSLSMDGYVKGNTSFEAAITKLLVLTKNYTGQQNLHINFINSKIYPSKEVDIVNFAEKLEPKSTVYNVGGKDRGISDLNKVFKTILDSTDKGKISILISDCIYSLGKNGDTEGRLNIQKSLTMDAFLTKLKSADISTICLKLTSEFNGQYYDYRNNGVSIKDIKRPYYIWIMGTSKEMDDFYSYLRSSSLEDYNNSFVMNFTKEGNTPYYTVLKETNRIGKFTADRSIREYVHQIEEIEFDKSNFQFSIAVDLSKLPVDSSYLLDINNYELSEGFTLQKIEKNNRGKITQRDWVTIEQSTSTHFFTIALKQNNSIRDLTIKLKKKLPGWIAATDCRDDSDIKSTSDKTFGLLKLAEGIRDAYITYSPKQEVFFSITINLKK